MFPVELTSRKQWLLWSFEQYEGDKKNHAKYRTTLTVKTSRHTRKPRRFGATRNIPTSKNALEFGDYSGLGFAFLPNDGLIGIDIDHKEDRDPQLAQKIITGLNTYTELSPSGRYHLFVLGHTKTFKNNDIGIEVLQIPNFYNDGKSTRRHTNEESD